MAGMGSDKGGSCACSRRERLSVGERIGTDGTSRHQPDSHSLSGLWRAECVRNLDKYLIILMQCDSEY